MPPNKLINIRSTIDQRTKAAHRAGITLTSSIQNRNPFKSGSKLVEDEFLLLRTILPKVRAHELQNVETNLGLDNYFQMAEGYLDSLPEFQNYLDTVMEKIQAIDASNMGGFWLPDLHEQHPAATGLSLHNDGESMRQERGAH